VVFFLDEFFQIKHFHITARCIDMDMVLQATPGNKLKNDYFLYILVFFFSISQLQAQFSYPCIEPALRKFVTCHLYVHSCFFPEYCVRRGRDM